MRRFASFFVLLFLTSSICACQVGNGGEPAPTPVETDACCLNVVPGLEQTLNAAPAMVETLAPTSTRVVHIPEATPSPIPSPTALSAQEKMDGVIRQGARFGSLEPYQVEDVAVGSYRSGLPACGDTYLTSLPEESGEIVLTLRYATPLMPEQIEIFTSDLSIGIQRVEMLNSMSGLGRLIYQAGEPIQSVRLVEGACMQRLDLPVQVDFEVDTIFIAFESLEDVAQVGAVELVGRLENYVGLPVFWRVPLPGTPVDIAAGQNGQVFVASEPNGLYAYDVEGNQLKQFSTPDQARLTSVAADPFGNLVVTDAAYGWFIVISPEGEHLTIGGDETFYQSAVNPLDGNLYLLHSSAVYVYTTDTGELIRQVQLDESHSHIGLAFDPQGRLYTIRDSDWSATLLVLDSLTGEELDAVPLNRSEQVEIVARDVAIDARGNIYILFAMNVGEIAVHMYDSQGDLVQRFGTLFADVGSWPEGMFLDPRAVTVSPDGRFILIADGFEGASYLSAFLVES